MYALLLSKLFLHSIFGIFTLPFCTVSNAHREVQKKKVIMAEWFPFIGFLKFRIKKEKVSVIPVIFL